MTKAAGSPTPGPEADAYTALVARFPLRPIRSEKEHGEALTIIDELLSHREPPPEEQDYLDVLSDLVSRWEDETMEMPDVSGVEMVRGLLEDRGMRQKDLVPIFGTESIVSEVLSGKREMQRRHVEGLARLFNVSPAVFFGGKPGPSRPRRRRIEREASSEPPVPATSYLSGEDRARTRIDLMLEAAGWVVQDARSVNLSAGIGVAVREFVLQQP